MGDEKIKSEPKEPKWPQTQKFHLGSNLNFSSSRNRIIANRPVGRPEACLIFKKLSVENIFRLNKKI